jgi:hexosaminidase
MKFIISCPLFIASALALWPQPVTYDHGDTVLFIKRDVPIHWYEVGPRNAGLVEDQQPFLFASNLEPGSDEEKDLKLRQRYVEPSFGDEDDMSEREGISEDEIIDYAIKSTWKTIFEQNLYPWKFHPRDWKEPSPEEHMASVSEINIKLLAQDPQHATKSLTSEVDESYTLTLSEDGKATITANTSIGISHGLTTFTQLFFLHSDSKHVYTPLAPITISDFPKFAHRGINLDVSRNWFSVADIKRQISAAASTKLNVFHLHVTDSQSWPLEIPALPELSAKGAYRPDLVYTPADFRAMQRHAALQGVRMITEIDMPGHTAVIHHAFPDLVAAFDKQDWDTWAAEPPSGTLKLNSSAVDAFLETLFADILPRVAPYARYFHTGGDEVNRNAYTLDDTVKSNDFAVLQPLMQKFIDTNHERVRAAGLTPIVWEEMLLEWNLTLGADVVVQSWRGDEALRGIVERGYKGLAGNYKYWVSNPFLFFSSVHAWQWLMIASIWTAAKANGSTSIPPWQQISGPMKIIARRIIIGAWRTRMIRSMGYQRISSIWLSAARRICGPSRRTR